MTKVVLLFLMLPASGLIAKELGLATRAVRLFSMAMVGGGMLLTTVVAQAEPANGQWQDVRADTFDYRRSVFHLRTNHRGFDYVLHLVYLGSDKDDQEVFIGLLPQGLRADEPLGREVRQIAEYSLYGDDGLIVEGLELREESFYPVKDSGKIIAVDVVVGMFGGLDMSDYQPVILDEFPAADDELELINYHPNREHHVLRWQSCWAGKYNSKTKLAYHSCRLPWRPAEQISSALGAPIFDERGRLVGLTSVQSDADRRQVWPTDMAVVFSGNMLRYIPLHLDVSLDRVLSTTWAELKKENR